MIDSNDIANIFPLTPLQEGMLLRELASGSDAYIMQTRLWVNGSLDTSDFGRAWNMLVERHEALRTLVSADGADRPLQVTLKHLEVTLPTTDVSGLTDPKRHAAVDEFCRKERETGFDLKRPPLFRLGLFRFSPSRHLLVLTFHHIIMDGWCQGILHDELLECYRALQNRQRPNLQPPQPFSRYVRYLSERDAEAGLSFWQSAMEAYEPGGETSWMKHLPLPGDAFDYRVMDFFLSPAITGCLREMTVLCGTTLNAVLQTLWGALICRLSGKKDVSWGTVVAGRPPELPGSDRTIGLFINTMPMLFRMKSTESFRDALRSTGSFLGQSLGHQYMPLADIQQACAAYEGLFDHLFIFENYPVAQAEEQAMDSLAIVPESPLYGHTDYDFICTVDVGESLDCRLKYNAAVIDDDDISLVRDSFITLADRVTANPDVPFSSMQILPGHVFHTVTHDLPTGETMEVEETTFPAMFSVQAAKTPERPAVEALDGCLTYRELDDFSDIITHILIDDEGVMPGDRVALMIGRNHVMIPGIIGTMKASAVFVPLDPGYPDDRIHFILDDCRCRALVADSVNAARLADMTSIPIIDIERAFINHESVDHHMPGCQPKSGDTAYIIYTSGSTGTPKGVVVKHRSLTNFIRGYIRTVLNFHNDPLRIAFVANYIFDAAGRAFYPSLCRGDTVLIVDEETRLDSTALMRYLADKRIDVLDGTPSLCSLALECSDVIDTVSRIVLGGETLTRGLAERIRRAFPLAALTNVYGPTETTIDSTFFHVEVDPGEKWDIAPIGRPLPNQRAYVLDDDLLPLPKGAIGEICIGGEGVAGEYLCRDDLTSKRFVPDPFNPGGMMYRTGDMGRWRHDDNLAFIGRRDSQVKVRGYRIETGEIEAVVMNEPEIGGCATVVRTDPDRGNSLCVFYTGDMNPVELRKRMRSTLPPHMIPEIIVPLESLPLTPTGKIDRKTLASLPVKASETTPRNLSDASECERLVMDAMNKILGRVDISPDDNFFEIGGHSLSAARLMATLASKTGKRLPIAALYRLPVAADLAAYLDRYDPEITGILTTFSFHFNEGGESLFCFPPYGATGIMYQPLARVLDGWRLTCFNFFDGMDFVREASRQILPIAKISPVSFIGYSGGGNLALEVAIEIEKKGGKVDRIFMLDSYRRLEIVDVPKIRHEQDMRRILASEEYSLYFTDESQREAAIRNGIAYADYLYSGMERGIVNAALVLIKADTDEADPARDRFGALRSRDKLAEMTRSSFLSIRGSGTHDDMLSGKNCEKNGEIIRQLLLKPL